MTRAFAVAAVIATVLTGCVSVSAPSVAPSTAPSLGITTPAAVTASPIASIATPVAATPTAAPTAPPTAEPPTPGPTAAPTVAPIETPVVEPSTPVETAPPEDTSDLLFVDNMDDPTSGWDEYDVEAATVGYAESALRVTVNAADTFAYGGRLLGAEYGAVLVAGELVPSEAGSGGLLCVAPADELGAVHAYGVVLNTDGTLFFVRVSGTGELEVLETNEIDADFAAGQSNVVGLACAGTSTGALRMVAFGANTGPLASYQLDEGPATFYGIGVYAEAVTAGLSVDALAIAAYGIPVSADGSMSPEVQELLTHVPGDWHDQCIESPVTENELAVIVCLLQQDGAGVELASYESFASNAEMDAAYDERVADFPVDEDSAANACEEGSLDTTWHIDDEVLGKLLCTPQFVGIRFDWTDDRLGILSNLIDFEGEYSTTYQTWLEAGPNP
ncbi:MAG: hypothetical protein ABIP53_06955 [Candidatus Limnocylindrales bacterium]